MLLRIIGSPVLAIEERGSYARIRLVHPNHDGTRCEGLLLGLVASLLPSDRAGGGIGELLNLDMLALENFEQLDFPVGRGRFSRNHVGRRPLERRLLSSTLALCVVVLEEVAS